MGPPMEGRGSYPGPEGEGRSSPIRETHPDPNGFGGGVRRAGGAGHWEMGALSFRARESGAVRGNAPPVSPGQSRPSPREDEALGEPRRTGHRGRDRQAGGRGRGSARHGRAHSLAQRAAGPGGAVPGMIRGSRAPAEEGAGRGPARADTVRRWGRVVPRRARPCPGWAPGAGPWGAGCGSMALVQLLPPERAHDFGLVALEVEEEGLIPELGQVVEQLVSLVPATAAGAGHGPGAAGSDGSATPGLAGEGPCRAQGAEPRPPPSSRRRLLSDGALAERLPTPKAREEEAAAAAGGSAGPAQDERGLAREEGATSAPRSPAWASTPLVP